jgi:hypothetical protein
MRDWRFEANRGRPGGRPRGGLTGEMEPFRHRGTTRPAAAEHDTWAGGLRWP